MPTDFELMTRAEVAELLRLRLNTLDHMAMRGEGPPFYRIGRSVRYERTALLAWIAAREVHRETA